MTSASSALDSTAATVEAAITQGLAQLGLARDQVYIDILQEPSRGILGLGARDAIVRLTPRPPLPPSALPPVAAPPPPVTTKPIPPPAPVVAPPIAPTATATAEAPLQGLPSSSKREAPASVTPVVTPPAVTSPASPAVTDALPAPILTAATPATDDDDHGAPRGPLERGEAERVAIEVLRAILQHMQIQARIHGHWIEPSHDDEDEQLVLDVQGNDLGVLIGHHGETLQALQYMTRLIAGRRVNARMEIVVDISGYKARHEQGLRRVAQQAAARAMQTGRILTMEPMSASDRRLIHMALRHHPDVITRSVGEGEQRKVTVVPKALARDDET